jgi:hypothetical protein
MPIRHRITTCTTLPLVFAVGDCIPQDYLSKAPSLLKLCIVIGRALCYVQSCLSALAH